MLIIFVLLIFITTATLQSSNKTRENLLTAYLIIGLFIVGLSIVLSYFNYFSIANIQATWLILAVIFGIILLRSNVFSLFYKYKQIKQNIFNYSIVEKILLVIFSIYLLILTIISATTPPNNYDGMTYHVPRAMHWLQNGSLEYYPTSIDRQLWPPPLAEIMIAHLYALAGGDQFIQLVQTFAYIISLVAVSLITRELGGSRRVQLAATAIAASIPMAILQATSVQNDLLVASLSLIAVYSGLRLFKTNYTSDVIMFSLAISLAMITKTTTFLYLAGFVVGLALALFNKRRYHMMVKLTLITSASILLINSWYWWQNWQQLGSVYPGQEGMYTNQVWQPNYLFSQVIKNVAVHLATPISAVNNGIHTVLLEVHDLLGADINDKRTMFFNSKFSLAGVAKQSHEDEAPNTVFAYLIILLTIWFVIKRKRLIKPQIFYAWMLLSSFVVFCVYLRWQPWISRLHLFYFLAAAPILALMLANILSRKVYLWFAVFILMLSTPWLFLNSSKPFIFGSSIFNNERMEVQAYGVPPYILLSEAQVEDLLTSGCRDIGLQIGGNDAEYYYWAILKSKDPTFKFEHQVSSKGKTTESCVIINTLDQTRPKITFQ